MPGTHHLFTVTRWLLRAATLFCFFLIAVLALALAILRARNVSTKVRQPVFEIKLERRAFGSAD